MVRSYFRTYGKYFTLNPELDKCAHRAFYSSLYYSQIFVRYLSHGTQK